MVPADEEHPDQSQLPTQALRLLVFRVPALFTAASSCFISSMTRKLRRGRLPRDLHLRVEGFGEAGHYLVDGGQVSGTDTSVAKSSATSTSRFSIFGSRGSISRLACASRAAAGTAIFGGMAEEGMTRRCMAVAW